MVSMRTVVRVLEVSGPLPPTTCWRRYDELAQWAEWAPQIVSVQAPANRLAVGLSGVVRVTGGLTVPFTVTEVDPSALTWSWIARLGPIPLSLHHGIHLSSEGTRASLAIEGPAAVVLTYAPLARLALWRLVSHPTSQVSRWRGRVAEAAS